MYIFIVSDHAYYDGKYYSYFGITPIILYYFPHYFIKGTLPALPTVSAFFGTVSVFFICMSSYTAIRLMKRKVNFLVLLMLFPAIICISGILYCLQITDMYFIPITVALATLSICFYTGMRAYITKNKIIKIILLIFSGLFLALCVGARPGMTTAAIILIPLFLGILRDKNISIGGKIAQSAAFCVPLIAGVCGLLFYNKLRFGSLFDFGATYQLTVSDIHANKLRLSEFPAAMVHYFFQLPKMKDTFPYFDSQIVVLRNYGSYKYCADVIGMLCYPLILAAIIFFKTSIKNKADSEKISPLQKKAIYILCAVQPIFLSWFNFCMGGVNLRYSIDTTPLIFIGVALIISDITSNPEKHPTRYKWSVISIASTFLMIVLLIIERRYCSLSVRYPFLYETLESLMVFWK